MDQQQPLSYYDDLRTAENTTSETVESSEVILVNGNIRLCQLLFLNPSASRSANEDGQVESVPINLFVYAEGAAFLAMKHFNERSSAVVPDLDERLTGCNVYFTADLRDTQFSPIQASRQLLEAHAPAHSLETPRPVAMIGAGRSAVSLPVGILGGVSYALPQISFLSTSAQLDNRERAPYFARTIPSNTGDAYSIVIYLRSLAVTRFGVMYVRDSYGSEYFSDLQSAAREYGVTVMSASYVASDEASIVTAAGRLKDSGLTYFVGILSPENYKSVLNRLVHLDIIGNANTHWLFSDGLTEIMDSGYRIPESEEHLANALHGSGVVTLDVPSNERLDKALNELETNTELQEHYIARHVAEPEIFKDFNLSQIPRSTSIFHVLAYDAVMAMGIAACDVEEDFFTGPQLYDQLRKTEFEGASGTVSFDSATGTRDYEAVQFAITNVLLVNSTSSDGSFRFRAQKSVSISPNLTEHILSIHPFIFWDGSEVSPPALPPIQAEMNLLSLGVRVAGWTSAALIACMSLGCAVWTWRNRGKPVVRASQPYFLCMICAGTFIMATAIIPMSLQEPISERGLDIACMSTPWVLSVGFVTSFSALFSKTWRLNKLFKKSVAFRRVEIQIKDVLLPFVALMSTNVIVLVVWTVIAPLKWTRRPTSSVDIFGRSDESYGTCTYIYDDLQYVFFTLWAFVNAFALLNAVFQIYHARKVPPSNFNESSYIQISILSCLETLAIALPLFFVTRDHPTAAFIVNSLLVVIVCLAILLPLFISKYINRDKRAMDAPRARVMQTIAATKSSSRGSRVSRSEDTSGREC